MNRIVRENYPVADLPEDLREGFATSMTAKVIVEVKTDRAETPTLADLMKLCGPGTLTSEEIQGQIDELRGEFDE